MTLGISALSFINAQITSLQTQKTNLTKQSSSNGLYDSNGVLNLAKLQTDARIKTLTAVQQGINNNTSAFNMASTGAGNIVTLLGNLLPLANSSASSTAAASDRTNNQTQAQAIIGAQLQGIVSSTDVNSGDPLLQGQCLGISSGATATVAITNYDESVGYSISTAAVGTPASSSQYAITTVLIGTSGGTKGQVTITAAPSTGGAITFTGNYTPASEVVTLTAAGVATMALTVPNISPYNLDLTTATAAQIITVKTALQSAFKINANRTNGGQTTIGIVPANTPSPFAAGGIGATTIMSQDYDQQIVSFDYTTVGTIRLMSGEDTLTTTFNPNSVSPSTVLTLTSTAGKTAQVDLSTFNYNIAQAAVQLVQVGGDTLKMNTVIDDNNASVAYTLPAMTARKYGLDSIDLTTQTGGAAAITLINNALTQAKQDSALVSSNSSGLSQLSSLKTDQINALNSMSDSASLSTTDLAGQLQNIDQQTNILYALSINMINMMAQQGAFLAKLLGL